MQSRTGSRPSPSAPTDAPSPHPGPLGSVTLWDLDPESLAEHACQMAGRNLSLDEWIRYMPSDIGVPQDLRPVARGRSLLMS